MSDTEFDAVEYDAADLAAVCGIDAAQLEYVEVDIYSPAFNAKVDSQQVNVWVFTASHCYYVTDIYGTPTLKQTQRREGV